MGNEKATRLRAGAITIESGVIGKLIPQAVTARNLTKDQAALLIKQLRGITETMLTVAMDLEAGATA